uniref:Uncharacterized protein n=2 Tax=Timema TaxID=61471 RepID=A0A7R9NVI6_9NEOP|nr:unnamed protein product [Timema bartmani]CAD7457827.1 unnamed protein product [Timema tahoe]
MAGVLGSHERKFTIDDAFEEENDEAIRIYGSTTEISPLKPKQRNIISDDSIIVRVENPNRSTTISTTPRFKSADDWSEFLATDPEVPGSIPGAPRLYCEAVGLKQGQLSLMRAIEELLE